MAVVPGFWAGARAHGERTDLSKEQSDVTRKLATALEIAEAAGRTRNGGYFTF